MSSQHNPAAQEQRLTSSTRPQALQKLGLHGLTLDHGAAACNLHPSCANKSLVCKVCKVRPVWIEKQLLKCA
ncbi:hypothetical protein Mapa_010704 [Marchantia paleacea]|nr:hypothetical protein Mapa_010704 [Marchantia paleacea]